MRTAIVSEPAAKRHERDTSSLTPEVRSRIVRHLGAALAAAWQRQQEQEQKHERPERLNHAAGRIVRGNGGREHHDRITIDA